MSERAVRWIVRGRVQGVGFRHFTIRTARSLGLRGTVRNMPDGTVEVRAAGPPEDLESLRERLARGPSPARVDDIRESAIESTADLPGGFEVRY